MRTVQTNCIHCGTPLESWKKESAFCCAGCEFVYQIIHEQGLDKFYELKRGETTTPLHDQPFQQPDLSWLEEAIKDHNSKSLCSSTREFQGSLQGISCIGCVWLVEKLFLRHDGALRCDIIPATGSIYLTWQHDNCDVLVFARELQQFGYVLGPRRPGRKSKGELRRLTTRMSICATFAVNSMAFSLPRYIGMPQDFAFANIFELITFLSATLAMLVGGSWFIKRAYHGLQIGVLHMDTPIALGVSLAYLGSFAGWLWQHEGLLYFDFVAIFIFLMLGGRRLQTAAIERNRNRLLERTPIPQKVQTPDSDKTIDTHDMDAGASYLLPAGQTAPVASILTNKAADFSLEWINGEPEPVHRSAGSTVPAGAINIGHAAVILRAEENWQQSLLAKLIQSSDTVPRSPLMEKVLRYYLSFVFLLGVSGGAGWLICGYPFTTSLQVVISVFVISCPCALGIALPMADELASAKMRTRGVFIRQASFWNRIMRIKTIFFDKTGTLTMDLPVMVNASAISNLNPNAKQALAALIEKSLHPMSRSIIRSMGTEGQQLARTAPSFLTKELPGLGTTIKFTDSSVWSLGKCGWDGSTDKAIDATQPGCELRHNGKLLVRFNFKEALRPEAAATLKKLSNYHPRILSGDHIDRVQDIAHELGVAKTDVYAGLSPENKAEIVCKIDPDSSLFLGDGANDSLAFDAASVSGAVAGRGLLETKADFYFLTSGLNFIPAMFALARQHSTATRSVFIFSAGYNLAAVTVCLAGSMNPLLAAILMPMSSITSLAIVSLVMKTNDSSKYLQ